MNNKITYLKMIEDIIERMAKNSFSIKGWTLTLVSILGALLSKNVDYKFLIIIILPAVMFWGLDSYYLNLERKYRFLYEEARMKKEKEINFKLSISMDKKIIDRLTNYIDCLFSISEVCFYLPIIVSIVIIFLIKGC